MRYAIRILLVAVVLLGVGYAERNISPPKGHGTTAGTPVPAAALPAGVALPGFATGFSVFLGEEANDANYPTEVATLLDRLVSLHVNSIALVYSVFQDGPDASVVTTDKIKTPTDDGLTLFIRNAHKRGLSVTLRPTLDETNLHSVDKWRGQITPTDVNQWFSTYGDLMVHYGTLAASDGVAALSVGVEFESMEQYTDQWRALIQKVRGVYTGEVTYSYNFQVQDLGFVDALDFVSLDAYYPLDLSTGATVDQISAAWQQWIPVMKKLETDTGKPLMLAEIGIRSQTNDFREPWKGHDNEQPSQQDQANYYAATCNILSDVLTGSSGAAIRATADATASVSENVPAQTWLKITGEPTNANGQVWQQVADPTSGTTGYALTSSLDGSPIYMGAYVWLATIGSLSYDATKDDDYPVFSKLAEPIIGNCFGQRIVGKAS